MLKVLDAKYIKDFTVLVSFNNNRTVYVDLKDELEGEIFEPLKDMDYFRNFYLDCNTICWQNGADFAPEYLLDISERALVI